MIKPLIIFDCDGVLVDTEAIANDRMATIFTSLGYQTTGADCRRQFQGKSLRDVCRDVSRIVGEPVEHQWLRRQIYKHLGSGVQAIAGAETAVATLLNDGYQVCVASSGSVEKMHMTLGQTDLLAMLKGVLFSADAVSRGKPFPDVFEYAASEMGRQARDAIVIEDSITGVEAGVAAGARVLGYCGDPFIDQNHMRQAGAHVFCDMAHVPQLVGE